VKKRKRPRKEGKGERKASAIPFGKKKEKKKGGKSGYVVDTHLSFGTKEKGEPQRKKKRRAD